MTFENIPVRTNCQRFAYWLKKKNVPIYTISVHYGDTQRYMPPSLFKLRQAITVQVDDNNTNFLNVLFKLIVNLLRICDFLIPLCVCACIRQNTVEYLNHYNVSVISLALISYHIAVTT